MMSEDSAKRQRIEQLLSALRDDNEALRDHAIASLGQIGPEAIPVLIGLFADDDTVIREAATSAVVRIGPEAVDPLIEALEDDEWAVREQAASGLGKLKDPRGVEPLMRALKDKDGAVRTAAVWALERIGDSRAVPDLVEALYDTTLREDVARVLKKIGDARAVDALVEGLLGTNWMVRRHAAEALGKIGDRAAPTPSSRRCGTKTGSSDATPRSRWRGSVRSAQWTRSCRCWKMRTRWCRRPWRVC